jgi:hypothetical protein
LVSAILGTLPLGLGIALNPIAIIAGILILRSAKARVNSLTFAVGWIFGLALLEILSTLLIQAQAGAERGAVVDLPAVIWIGAGVVLLIAAILAFRGRALPGNEPEPPRWLRVVDRAGPFHTLGIGLFLATVSLKNLALLAAAGSVIGQANLEFLELALTIAAFLVISSLGILVPLLVRLFGGAEADARLAQWGDWLTRHMGRITAVVLVLLGAYLLARGIAGVL